LKRIAACFGGESVRGEAVITAEGIEGGPVYALSGPLRDEIARHGSALLHLDLRPDLDFATLAARLPPERSGMSIANVLRVRAGLSPAASALVQEALHSGCEHGGADLATLIKALPVRLLAPFGLERAISSAGGLKFDAMDAHFMLRSHPGVFAAGEMLDWEAPTGGYLLQACLSTGRAAAHGVLDWLKTRD
jgi:predicted flavoprotein YhiN